MPSARSSLTAWAHCTEELTIANRYYAWISSTSPRSFDYGFSKRLEEALSKWPRECPPRRRPRDPHRSAVCPDHRFQGIGATSRQPSEPAGLITSRGLKLRRTRRCFRSRSRPGYGPGSRLKLYRVASANRKTGRSGWIPGSTTPSRGLVPDVARLGLSFQRFRTADASAAHAAVHAVAYYKRLQSVVDARPRKRRSSTASTRRSPVSSERCGKRRRQVPTWRSAGSIAQ